MEIHAHHHHTCAFISSPRDDASKAAGERCALARNSPLPSPLPASPDRGALSKTTPAAGTPARVFTFGRGGGDLRRSDIFVSVLEIRTQTTATVADLHIRPLDDSRRGAIKSNPGNRFHDASLSDSSSTFYAREIRVFLNVCSLCKTEHNSTKAD